MIKCTFFRCYDFFKVKKLLLLLLLLLSIAFFKIRLACISQMSDGQRMYTYIRMQFKYIHMHALSTTTNQIGIKSEFSIVFIKCCLQLLIGFVFSVQNYRTLLLRIEEKIKGGRGNGRPARIGDPIS